MPDDVTPWAAIRHAYCETPSTIAEICAEFAITPARLRSRRLQEAWPARPSAAEAARQRSGTAAARKPAPRKAPPAGKSRAATATPAARPAAPAPRRRSTASRAATIQRLYNAIDLKLTQLERQMTGSADTTPADHEREVRALATLIQNFERVSEIDAAARSATDATAGSRSHRPGGPTVRSDAAAADGGAADAERLRREIAERLDRILAKRNTAGAPGGT